MKKRARAVSYFLSVVALAAVFCGIEFVAKKLFYPDGEAVDVVGDIVGALLFVRSKQFFDRVTDRIFFRGPAGGGRADLFTTVSHELQTPIAILRGNVELLQRRGTADEERAAAERVIVATLDGMSRLIGGVLESAKLRSSGQHLQRETISVDALLREVREGCLLLAEEKGINLSVGVNKENEDVVIRGDPGKLKEVIFNLISNALKYTARGGAIMLRGERRGAAVHIVVDDTGSGIAPEDLPHIFERFYRIRNASRPNAAADGPTSNGIGLNICRGIVEAHGGTIIAESRLGKGSRFTISLPLAPSAHPIMELPACAGAQASASAIINS